MKKDLIGYCGIDCEQCDCRIATIKNDNEMKKRVAALWSKLNNVEIKPEHINCLGCKGDGVKCYFCSNICEVKKCAISKKFNTCEECKSIKTCDKIKPFLSDGKDPKKTIKI